MRSADIIRFIQFLVFFNIQVDWFLLAIKFKEVFCFQEGAIGAYGKF